MATTDLMSTKQVQDYLVSKKNNNCDEKVVVEPTEDFSNLCNEMEGFPNDLFVDVDAAPSNIFNRFISNSSNSTSILKFDGNSYIIPKRSTFTISPFTSWITQTDRKFDLVVMDPPWENKSAKRKKSYNYLPEHDLKKLPLQKILQRNSLVVVWVTNKQKYLEFVRDVLFPIWGVQCVGHWHWVKVRCNGNYVTPMESAQRKPYEPILIGRKLKDSSQPSLPFKNIICSVPLNQHSRKPPLNEMLKNFLPDEPSCLEIFARSLIPDWTSWGNETIKYQHSDYFEEKTIVK